MRTLRVGSLSLLFLVAAVRVDGQATLGPPVRVVPEVTPPAQGGGVVAPVQEPLFPAVEGEGDPNRCGRPGRVWVSGEYLLWWIKNDSVPPLVTASPPGTPRVAVGVLPGATVLFGGSDVDNQERSGGRFTAGAWLDPEQTVGVEGSFFFLGERTVTYDTGFSPGVPLLARPVLNVVTGLEDAELVAFPGVLSGRVTIASASRLLGAEGNLIWNLRCRPTSRIDLLGGYRFLRLDESLGITEDLTVLGGTTAGTRIIVADRFATRNEFHGGQLGVRASLWRGPWELALTAKAAFGVNLKEANIDGQTTFIPPGGGPVTQPGGLLALPSNIGHYREDRFAVVPEGVVQVGYHFTERLMAFASYTFLYVSDVARPGGQIDRAVNRSQIPGIDGPRALEGPARPAFLFDRSDFWSQGVSLGVRFSF